MRKNPRQTELFNTMQELLGFACITANDISTKKQIDFYDAEIEKELFLAQFTVNNGAGYLARERYYKDFVTTGVFVEVYEGETPNGYFKISPDAKYLAHKYDISFPKTKAERIEQTQTQ
jgi:hypothetical protein